MADPRPPIGTNFQQNRPLGPPVGPNMDVPGNPMFTGPPQKMGMAPGPPPRFGDGPPLGPPSGPPSGPPGSQHIPLLGPRGTSVSDAMPPFSQGNRLPQPNSVRMEGPRPPVNGFSASQTMQGVRTPGPPNRMMGPPPSSTSGGSYAQVSQTGQMLNGPTSGQTAVNGGYQMGPPPTVGSHVSQGPRMFGGPPPRGQPPSNMRPPGPPPQGGSLPTSGPPPMRPLNPPPSNVSSPPLPPSMSGQPPTGLSSPPGHPPMSQSHLQGSSQQPPGLGQTFSAGPPSSGPAAMGGPPSQQQGQGPSNVPGNVNAYPPSQRSSRAPSPIANQSYDALEGQFTPSTPGQGMPPVSSPPGMGAPSSQDMSRTTGITGRRLYPQAPSGSMPPPPVSQNYQPGPQGFPSGPNQGYQPAPTQGYQTYQQNQGYQQGGPQPFQQGPTQGYQPGPGIQQGGYSQPPPGSQFQQPPGPMSGPQGPYQPNKQPGQGMNNTNALLSDFSNMGMNDSQRILNLLQERRLIPTDGLEIVKPILQHNFKKVNVNTDIFRCTLNALPQTSSLLNKARLPLGILIHPFKDLSQLPVIQSSVIVRCRSCRTYINPFVHFVDQRRWKCNLCYRINDLPDEFSFDPVSKTYGDPQRRPEVKSATIEFIAPSEYMLRPPQPAVYLFLLDVSFNALETGYLQLFCQILLEELDKMPGDSRTQIGFLAYDRFLYYFGLAEGQSQPQMMVVPDLDDPFLPCPDNLLVNLQECKDLVIDLLNQLPSLFKDNMETGSALGAALQAAFKLVSSSGGRVTVMQTVLPTVGPGALQNRETAGASNAKNNANLGPATDFYKKLALDCSAQQVSVDLFMLNGQYADIASLSCVSKYSAGCVYYYPSFHTMKTTGLVDRYDADLRRYLTRKIGFEAVMRIRCTRGLSIHTFHGNFFVRSTDLLSLPNINPDAGFGMQMSIEDNLTDTSSVCFQAALLYTSSKGERRIRVHTLCLPVTNQLSEVYAGADQQAIICLLAKMAVDRSLSASLGDARDALMNAAIDCIGSYSQQLPSSQRIGALPLPFTLRVVPLFVLAMLNSSAFQSSSNVKLDDRVFSLLQCKTLPVNYLMQLFYPHLYPVHGIEERNTVTRGGLAIPKPPLLQLSSANIDRHGAYIMDVGNDLFMLVGASISDQFCQDVLDKPNFMSIPEGMNDLPENDNPTSERLRNFVNYLMDSRPYGASFLVVREDNKAKHLFFQHMVEDKTESSMSYYEFLQYLQQRTKS